MRKTELINELEMLRSRWSGYLPEDGIPMFEKEINKLIELSKKYKRK